MNPHSTPQPQPQSQHSLGPKGYTLIKSLLGDRQVEEVKRDLVVRPVKFNTRLGRVMPSEEDQFEVYRENTEKLYVPYHYGVQHFGVPRVSRIGRGGNPFVTPGLQFAGTLRDYQVEVIEGIIAHLRRGGVDPETPMASCLAELYCGWGKSEGGIYISAAIGECTLIVTHKEDLAEQWRERYLRCMPGVKIGVIQGPKIQVEGFDVVICMIQSLAGKEYPESLFAHFGLVIFDEVHHISAQFFSNTLFKLVRPKMLGLSATMDRKDGTTEVFKMFLGEVLYSRSKREGFDVEVRKIRYQVADAEFNRTEKDVRGNDAHARMIGKLCEYNARSEFILRVLHDLLEMKDANGAKKCPQILILGHNKTLLTYLHDAVAHRGWATVGYYMGGMRKQLKFSKDKRVIIATYSMAAEGMDIPELSTAILATPQSDVVQCVGRILRSKKSAKMVVDIVDAHEIFEKRWKKRRTYYRKEGYTIYSTTSARYTANFEDVGAWTTEESGGKTAGNRRTLTANSNSGGDGDEDNDTGFKLPKGKCMI